MSGDGCGEDPREFGAQRYFIKQLGSYLAKGSVAYCISNNGNIYQKIIGSTSTLGSSDYSIDKLSNMIDYKRLYEDNPRFDIAEFDQHKVKTPKHKFKFTTGLLNHYADHAHQFNKTRQNVPPTINDVLNRIYNDSIYSLIPWFNRAGTIKWSPIKTLGTMLDFDFMRKGYEPKFNDRKHQRGAHDRFSVRPDPVYNDGYQIAQRTYVGGMNLSGGL